MATPLKIVSQDAMDMFYQDYAPADAFFKIEDFIRECGATLSEYYRQGYETEYARLRSEGLQDNLVTFDEGVLNEQILDFENNEAKITKSVFSFPYDKSSVGYQYLFSEKENSCPLERASITLVWQFPYIPYTNRIFWWPDRGKMKYFTNSNSKLKRGRLLYVPAITEDMEVPDALLRMVIDNTVKVFAEFKKGNVIKKSIDENPNAVLETEANLNK